jgi:hypothetical protein
MITFDTDPSRYRHWRLAWDGPIVMSNKEELQQSYAELQHGKFLNPERQGISPSAGKP